MSQHLETILLKEFLKDNNINIKESGGSDVFWCFKNHKVLAQILYSIDKGLFHLLKPHETGYYIIYLSQPDCFSIILEIIQESIDLEHISS